MAERPEYGQEGLSLMEMLVAVTLLGVLFTALGGVLTHSMVAGLFARQNQNAIDLISETIETYRGVGYAALAHDPTDVPGGDPAITTCGGTHCYTPRGGVAEPLVKLNRAVIQDHQRNVTRGATVYTLSAYVTQPPDATIAGAEYKRLVVEATWSKSKSTQRRQATTLITLQRRGLPLPNLTFGDPVAKVAGQGTTLVLPARIVNRGHRDAWNLPPPVTKDAGGTAVAWSFTWYEDAGVIGKYEAGVDLPLTHTDGAADAAGNVDTGNLETDEQIDLLALAPIPSTEPAGAYTVALTAASSAQPGDPNGTKTITDTVEVQADGCLGCTYVRYVLRNSLIDPPADTPAQLDMPVSDTPSTTATLHNYDTDHDGLPGRLVLPGGLDTTTTLATMANWVHPVPRPIDVGSTAGSSPALVRLYTAASASVQVFLRRSTDGGSTFTTIGTSAVVTTPASAYAAFEVPVPLPPLTELAKNDLLEVKVVADGSGAVLAYDTSTLVAQLRLPVVSGI